MNTKHKNHNRCRSGGGDRNGVVSAVGNRLTIRPLNTAGFWDEWGTLNVLRNCRRLELGDGSAVVSVDGRDRDDGGAGVCFPATSGMSTFILPPHVLVRSESEPGSNIESRAPNFYRQQRSVAVI